MKKLLVTAVAAATLMGGAAIAQPYGYDRGDYRADRAYAPAWVSINDRQARLDRRIDQGIRSGQLTRREAWNLRNQFTQISRLEARYRVNGLSSWERADLDRRFDNLSSQIRAERRDDQRRYGYNSY